MKKANHILPIFYLLLSLFGGFFTYYFVILGVIENKGSFDVLEFIGSTWTTSFYAKSITLDFWTTALAAALFMVVECKRLKMKNVWLYLFLTFFIAFAFAFPMFLYFRQKYLNTLREVN